MVVMWRSLYLFSNWKSVPLKSSPTLMNRRLTLVCIFCTQITFVSVSMVTHRCRCWLVGWARRLRWGGVGGRPTDKQVPRFWQESRILGRSFGLHHKNQFCCRCVSLRGINTVNRSSSRTMKSRKGFYCREMCEEFAMTDREYTWRPFWKQGSVHF